MIKDEHFEIVGVVTQPDRPSGRKLQLHPSPVKELVQPLGIPIFTPENINEDAVLTELEQLRAEVVVVVAFGQILRQKFLDMYPARVVNVHASILPRWRGAAPIQRSLMAGDTESGVSLQLVVRKLDAGALLGVRKFSQPPEMNALDAYKRCSELGALLIEVDLMDYLRGNLSAVPQDETQVTHAAKIEKSESEIVWSNSAESIHNLVRGLAMGPVAQTHIGGKILKVHRTKVHASAKPGAKPGQIIEITKSKSVLVQCGAGSLELLEVQPESRSRMPIEEYLRGHSVQAGDSFGPQSQTNRQQVTRPAKSK
jgi:methionyl-tRNA formyltransferase